MADGITIDTHEAREFAADLFQIPTHLQRHVIPVVQEHGKALERAMADDFRASRSFKGVAPSVTSESADGGFAVEAGPENPLASIGYFGGAPWSVRRTPGPGWQQGPGGGGTVRDPLEPLQDQGDKMSKSISELAAELLR